MSVSGGSFAVVLFLTALAVSANGKPAKDGEQRSFEKNARVADIRKARNNRAAQTAGTMLQTTKEIEIINGTAKTYDSPGGSTANNAFNFDKNAGCFWGGYANGQWKRIFPHMVWYEFPSTHIPVKMSFQTCGGGARPKKWKFVGSSDKNCNQYSSWTELCGDSGTFGGDDLYTCDVPAYTTGKFRCLGVRVYSNNPRGNHAWTVVGMRFWESTRKLSV